VSVAGHACPCRRLLPAHRSRSTSRCRAVVASTGTAGATGRGRTYRGADVGCRRRGPHPGRRNDELRSVRRPGFHPDLLPGRAGQQHGDRGDLGVG
jgi:hypothetical protein